MSTSKAFTPGPWSDDGGSAYFARTSRIYAGRTLIAEVGNADTTTQETWAANARLIAAAPDLLAAAKRVLTNLNRRIEADPDTAKPVFDGIADLHTAIFRAEGRSP